MTLTTKNIKNIAESIAEDMIYKMYEKMPRTIYTHVEDMTIDLLDFGYDAMAEVEVEYGYDINLAYIEVVNITIKRVYDEEDNTLSMVA
ncbi:MAG: hypothetical protein KBT34_05500 [Prevotella sp.]|nr:hypothetical protein [Candidatus Prevotella equi]